MIDYLLYGLHVQADIPLLAPLQPKTGQDSAPELIIEAVQGLSVAHGEVVSGTSEMSVILDRSLPAEWRLRYQRLATWANIVLMPGHIAYCCSANVDPRDIARVIVPSALAIYALMLRRPMLHGAVLEIDGQGVALLGASEAGKSTTTAALVAAGCRLVTEELILLPDGADLGLAPGLPLISLSPGTVPYLPSLPRLAPLFRDPDLARSKLLWLLPASACIAPQERVPLAAICVLDQRLAADQPPACEPLNIKAAAAEILPHAYWSNLQPPETLDAIWKACVPLAQENHCARLALPTGIDRVFQEGPGLKTLLKTLIAGAP